MNIVIFDWQSFASNDIKKVLYGMGHNVYFCRKKYRTFKYDEILVEEFGEEVDGLLKEFKVDCIFTTNYFESVAEVAYTRHIKYISWCYDSPVELGSVERLKYETNYVFLFDKGEAEYYRETGLDNVYYLPLAVNIVRYDSVSPGPQNIKDMSCDISFVGQLYESELPQYMESLSDYSKAYIKALIDSQSIIYGKNILGETITESFMEYISTPEFCIELNKKRKNKAIPDQELIDDEPDSSIPHPGRLIFLLQRLITNRERMTLIALLSEYFNFNLYSENSKKYDILKKANHCGTIDADVGALLAYKTSKINLNISVRHIGHAIPLRCLDIMGCGGFLLTNYQPGLLEHFVEDRDLVIYKDPQDALDKATYYLDDKHSIEREKIAHNGYKKVRKYHNYPDKFREMFRIAGLETI